MATMLNRPALVLNRNWQPVNVATVARALVMLFNEAARVVDPHDYQLYTWADWSRLAPRDGEPFIQAVSEWFCFCRKSPSDWELLRLSQNWSLESFAEKAGRLNQMRVCFGDAARLPGGGSRWFLAGGAGSSPAMPPACRAKLSRWFLTQRPLLRSAFRGA